jgi:hypothetical protein
MLQSMMIQLTQYCMYLEESNQLLTHNNNWCMSELSARLNQTMKLSDEVEDLRAGCASLLGEAQQARGNAEELLSELECESEAHAHTRARLLAVETVRGVLTVAVPRVMEKRVAAREESLVQLVRERRALRRRLAEVEARADTTGVLMAAALEERDRERRRRCKVELIVDVLKLKNAVEMRKK